MKTYKIVRFFSDERTRKDMRGGLTLGEAQEHCNLVSTEGVLKDGTRWFDGYTKEEDTK